MGYYDDQRRIMAQQNRQADARAAAENQARRDASHKSFMQSQERIGEQLRQRNAAMFDDRRARPRVESVTSGGAGKAKGGTGAALLVLIVIGVIVLTNSDSHKSTNNQQPSPAISSRPERQVAPKRPAQVPAPMPIAPRQERTAPQQFTYAPSAGPYPSVSRPWPPAQVPTEPFTPLNPTDARALPRLEAVNRVNPQYPEMARQSGMRGTVVITVGVSPNGAVVTTNADRGNPILVQAAIYAARQWRFNPYAAKPGDPLRTTTINFKFGDE